MMSRYRRNCLIISLCCFAVAFLAASQMSWGGTETRLGIYAQASNNLGYEPGLGAGASHVYRDDWWAVEAGGNVAAIKKTDADHGYTYSALAAARICPWRDWYVSGGWAWYGYRSEFASGTVWKKSATSPVLGCGYDGERVDFGLRYYQRENNTPNRVEAAKIECRLMVSPDWELSAGYGLTWYDQGGEMDSGYTVGVGVSRVFR